MRTADEMQRADVYAVAFALLGSWGVYTASQLARAPRPWSGLRRYSFLADVLLVSSCFLLAATLAGRWFAAWMVLPFGLSYAAMIPIPCYIELVNRVAWIHVLRNAVFAVIAGISAGVAFDWIPLRLFGL